MTWSYRDPDIQDHLIQRSLSMAEFALPAGDVPVGALMIDSSGAVIGTGFNTRERDLSPLGHAELNALHDAAAHRRSWNLTGCVLAVTLEPCVMCAGAIVQSRVSAVIFGAWDAKAGGAGGVVDLLREPRLNHQVEVYAGIREEQCAQMLREFFAGLRERWTSSL